uniref:TRAP transporter large permease subunit n=1 Tax=uncultured Paenalcaligenes sp. TaxID=1588925 RepID=UPI0026234C8F
LDYNEERTHESLGDIPPSVYRQQLENSNYDCLSLGEVDSVSAQASIGKLFIAGILPGLLMGLALMITAFFISKKNGWRGEAGDRSLRAIIQSLWHAKWALLVPVIILGGIYGGIMTQNYYFIAD